MIANDEERDFFLFLFRLKTIKIKDEGGKLRVLIANAKAFYVSIGFNLVEGEMKGKKQKKAWRWKKRKEKLAKCSKRKERQRKMRKEVEE